MSKSTFTKRVEEPWRCHESDDVNMPGSSESWHRQSSSPRLVPMLLNMFVNMSVNIFRNINMLVNIFVNLFVNMFANIFVVENMWIENL